MKQTPTMKNLLQDIPIKKLQTNWKKYTELSEIWTKVKKMRQINYWQKLIFIVFSQQYRYMVLKSIYLQLQLYQPDLHS